MSGGLGQRARQCALFPSIGLVARGQIDTASLVTDCFGLDATADAFATATKRAGLKVVVEPNAEPAPGPNGGTTR